MDGRWCIWRTSAGKRRTHIRIIGLSMFNDVDTQKTMLDAGATGFVAKSDHSENLLRVIREKPCLTSSGLE